MRKRKAGKPESQKVSKKLGVGGQKSEKDNKFENLHNEIEKLQAANSKLLTETWKYTTTPK
jgi:hypothetical protein